VGTDREHGTGAGNVHVTGLLRGRDGELSRVEVEVQGGSGRVRLAQGLGPLPDSQVGALVVDDVPEVVAFEAGGDNGALALLSPASAPLKTAPSATPVVDEARVLALSDVLLQLGDGLYTVGASTSCLTPRPLRGWSKGGVGVVDVVAAPDGGAAVLASLGRSFALLAGRTAATSGAGAWIIAADVIVDASGFEPGLHDRGAREAFARSPRGALDDAALRDALAALRASDPDVALGPFTEDRVEPAAQQARALVWDLRAEDGIESVADPVRERVPGSAATEFRSRVRVKSVTLEVAFVSMDGRHVDEAIVRSGPRFRATGLRPAARTLARTLRQLADEGQ
jgi:hypothetical protein